VIFAKENIPGYVLSVFMLAGLGAFAYAGWTYIFSSDESLRSEVKLPETKKLTGISWKEGELWILMRPRRMGENPETWIFSKAPLKWPQWPEEIVLIER